MSSAVDWLVGDRPGLDFEDVTVVVPGSRAGRRLMDLLAGAAARAGAALYPPRVVTVGGLPEVLVEPVAQADEASRLLAWVEALRGADVPVMQPVDDGGIGGWLAMARLADATHAELAGECLTFDDVVAIGDQLDGFPDGQRWRALARAQRLYLDRLKERGLADVQMHRLGVMRGALADKPPVAPGAVAPGTGCPPGQPVAPGVVAPGTGCPPGQPVAPGVVAPGTGCPSGQPVAPDRLPGAIVLVGVADLPGLARRLLDAVADRVTALIVAPEPLADRFDAHGCVIPERWAEVVIDLGDAAIEVADDPPAQAVAAMAALGESESPDDTVICAADERDVPYLEHAAHRLGTVRLRPASGKPIAPTRPITLLEAASAYVRTRRFDEWATLLRHPDVATWVSDRLDGAGDWIATIDAYQRDCLIGEVTGRWHGASRDQRRVLSLVHDAIAELLGELLSNGERPVSAWAEPILSLLQRAYGGRFLDERIPAQRVLIESCRAIGEAVVGMGRAASSVQCSAHEAARFATGLVSSRRLAPEADDEAIEVLGWLEMPLDDAPRAILTGFNEGCVPSGGGGIDPLLPEPLRRALGLPGDERRYARDAHSLSIITASREATIIARRRSAANDPLMPSRLLMACEEGELAGRVLRLTGGKAEPRELVPRVTPGGVSGFRVRPFPGPRPVERMRVTSFASYLRSPYGFYLEHVLELAEVEDRAAEMDARSFGILMHDVLSAFGKSEQRNSTNTRSIYRFLHEALNELAQRRFGQEPLPAIRVQLRQMRARLYRFAAWQARRASAGWRIERAEWSPKDAQLVVDGEPMRLTGRIDRIDHNPASGEWAILDYKTGEAGDPPEKTHRGRKGWRDLQLPLYRMMVDELDIAGPVRLGYVLLPKELNKIAGEMAAWDEDDLQSAYEAAEDVVRAVRAGELEEPGEKPLERGVLGAICGHGLIVPRDMEGGVA